MNLARSAIRICQQDQIHRWDRAKLVRPANRTRSAPPRSAKSSFSANFSTLPNLANFIQMCEKDADLQDLPLPTGPPGQRHQICRACHSCRSPDWAICSNSPASATRSILAKVTVPSGSKGCIRSVATLKARQHRYAQQHRSCRGARQRRVTRRCRIACHVLRYRCQSALLLNDGMDRRNMAVSRSRAMSRCQASRGVWQCRAGSGIGESVTMCFKQIVL